MDQKKENVNNNGNPMNNKRNKQEIIEFNKMDKNLDESKMKT